jgi:hypothetical protein
MAPAPILARGWTFKIDGTAGTAIGGIDSFTPSDGSTEADTTTFDDNGFPSHLISSRTKSISFAGKYLVDVATGALDPGQKKIMEYSQLIDTAGMKTFYMADPSGNNKWEFTCSVSMGDGGGGNDDPTAFNFSVKASGQVTQTLV